MEAWCSGLNSWSENGRYHLNSPTLLVTKNNGRSKKQKFKKATVSSQTFVTLSKSTFKAPKAQTFRNMLQVFL